MTPTSLEELHEMLGLCCIYKELGYLKVQLDTEVATEILERLIAFEQASPGK